MSAEPWIPEPPDPEPEPCPDCGCEDWTDQLACPACGLTVEEIANRIAERRR